MAGAKVHGWIGNTFETIYGVGLPYLWTAHFDGGTYGVRTLYDRDTPVIVDIWEITTTEDGRELGTAELWALGNAGDVIKTAIAVAISDEVERMTSMVRRPV